MRTAPNKRRAGKGDVDDLSTRSTRYLDRLRRATIDGVLRRGRISDARLAQATPPPCAIDRFTDCTSAIILENLWLSK
ncbi:unnamed protein product [Arctia plantaginis]|uniref:Uncharacterized protein n=1 Tax=Arctia plantaginis TaxID=874455 RepID=A0A8S0YQ07_ARCPL|nr:unnamed protein product [Arctia plantaginis]